MAQIPLGEFDRPRVLSRTGASRPDLSGTMDAARAIEGAGRTAMAVGERVAQAEERRIAEAEQQAELLARAKAANAVAEYRLQIDAAAEDVADQLRRGGDYTRAGELYDEAVGRIEPPTIEGLPPHALEAYQGGIANSRTAGRLKVDGSIVQARRDDGQTQFNRLLDALGKSAGQPGADIESINAQARASIPLFRAFGLDGSTVDKAVQSFEDRNWSNQALQRYNGLTDDPAGLQALFHDLTDGEGFYAGKLDADKRTVIAARVQNRLDVLAGRAERAADKLDATAERALLAMDEQFATGVPATAEQWAAWSEIFTEASPERREQFQQRIAEEQEIQGFLRQPIDQQLQGLQARQAKLYSEGGDKRAISNFNRIKSAVEANVKLLTEQPLQFAQARQGEEVPELDLSALTDPAAARDLGQVLQARAGIVDGLRKQYGHQVQANLLLPQELQIASQVIQSLPPQQRGEIFGQLRRAAGSDSTYTAVMQQLAPDAPVLSMAGMLHLRNPKAAALVLRGEALLNPQEGSKATMPRMPKQADFDYELDRRVRDAFRGREDAYAVAADSVRAAYAGAVAADGDLSGELDVKRLRNVIRAVLGETEDINGRGRVFVPYGMDPDEFEDKVESAWEAALPRLPEGMPAEFSRYGLQQAGDGTYYVTAGRMFVTDANGEPLILEVRR